MESRVPMTMTTSLALHGAALFGYIYMTQVSQTTVTRVISNVDILVAPSQTPQAAPARKPESMKDFLKLALPSIPKVSPMEARAPELRRTPMEVSQPKLQDRGKMQSLSKLEALDMNAHRLKLAKVEEPVARHAAAPMALPKLEEVGSRRAPRKAIEMAALEEKQGRLAPMGLGEIAPQEHRRLQMAAPLLPQESASKPSALSKMADMLTSQAPIALEPKSIPRSYKDELSAPAPVRERTQTPQQIKNKAVEIEGPLANRKVLAYSVPKFPDWAKDLGILEAAVSIRFDVDPGGQVLDTMRVERTSGFGRLDRLALEHLKLWRFAPLPDASGNEWGVITFRFILE